MGWITSRRRRYGSIEKAKRIKEEMKDLSVQHYDIHLKQHAFLCAVESETRNISQKVHEIENENIANLETALRSLKQVGDNIVDEHKRNIETLSHHTQLLELLEIPQLLDTCVRNKLYDEALDLRSFVLHAQQAA